MLPIKGGIGANDRYGGNADVGAGISFYTKNRWK
jgi:hypothetical protein